MSEITLQSTTKLWSTHYNSHSRVLFCYSMICEATSERSSTSCKAKVSQANRPVSKQVSKKIIPAISSRNNFCGCYQDRLNPVLFIIRAGNFYYTDSNTSGSQDKATHSAQLGFPPQTQQHLHLSVPWSMLLPKQVTNGFHNPHFWVCVFSMCSGVIQFTWKLHIVKV